jgi:mRNA deadenylase 3'-5' endonuclease subunit Ccr4
MLAEKEKNRIQLGLPDPKAEPVDTFNTNFIERPMLRLPDTTEGGDESNRITIMTYNVLAQSLIRRRLFPSSGKLSLTFS